MLILQLSDLRSTVDYLLSALLALLRGRDNLLDCCGHIHTAITAWEQGGPDGRMSPGLYGDGAGLPHRHSGPPAGR